MRRTKEDARCPRKKEHTSTHLLPTQEEADACPPHGRNLQYLLAAQRSSIPALRFGFRWNFCSNRDLLKHTRS